MKRQIYALILIFGLLTVRAIACTTAVISGKATPDGRSMIWKLRDTDELQNSMRYFEDGDYPYIGLVDSKDTEGKHVWGGTNSVGFAIMNSASFNVNLSDLTVDKKDCEGSFMKQALQICKTLEDFEKLLETTPKPMGLAAHFGVIDAEGGAAFYEVNNYTWTKFDANEAPQGYVLRTNYSETGKPDIGYGFIRRQTAEKIVAEAVATKSLDYQTVLQHFSRCFYHPVFNIDYRIKYESGNYETDFISSDDMITRQGSASSIVIQGIKKEESPDMNTCWIQIGFPETCISIPLWVRGGNNIPQILRYDETLKNSPLNHFAENWKKEAYPIGRADGYHYLKMTVLVNPQQTGYLQRIETFEKELFREIEQRLSLWRAEHPSPTDMETFYTLLNRKIEAFYTSHQSF